MKSSFITIRLSTRAAASTWVLLGRDQTLEQGKGGMCLSSPYVWWRHCWDSGGICGGESIPRHCSLCSHFNCSYSPKALKWGTSSTTPCLSVRAKPDQAKANHLTLPCHPPLMLMPSAHHALPWESAEQNSWGSGTDPGYSGVTGPQSAHQEKQGREKELGSKTSWIWWQCLKGEHKVRPGLFCASPIRRWYKSP